MKRTLLAAMASSLLFVTRVVCGFIVFRLLYQALDAATFGFYAAMWSALGFLVLANLGLGVAAYREAAALDTVHDKVDRRGRSLRLSAIVWGNHLLAVLLFAAAVVAGVICQALQFEHARALQIFMVGAVLVFATGIYREILRGRYLNWIIDVVDITQSISSAIALCFAIWSGAGLEHILLISLGSQLAANLILVLLALRSDWALGWPRLDLQQLRSIAGFSASSYGITVATIVGRCDQILLGSIMGLAQLPPYAVASRLTTYFEQASGQVEGAVAPLAVRQEHRDRAQRIVVWQRIFFLSQRCTAAIAIPMATVLIVDREVVLSWLTGSSGLTPTMNLCAVLMIAAVLLSRSLSSSTRWMLLLTGGHRTALRLVIIDTSMRLGIGGILAWWLQDAAGMAMGILAAACASTVLLQPFAIGRHLGLSRRNWWEELIKPLFWIALLSAIFMVPWALFFSARNFLHTASGSGLGLMAIVMGSWIFAIDDDVRCRLKTRLRSMYHGLVIRS